MFKLSTSEKGTFYATYGSAGFDICAEDTVVVRSNDWVLVPTAIRILEVEYPDNKMIPEIQIRSRSGLAANHGIVVLGGISTIDSDFKGFWSVPIFNHGKKHYRIERGDRIAQGIFSLVYQLDSIEKKDIERGMGGFGSTGK